VPPPTLPQRRQFPLHNGQRGAGPETLMGHVGKAEDMMPRYTAKQRLIEDATALMQSPSRARIDPNFTDRDCKKGN
jgi:hypothetical protein